MFRKLHDHFKDDLIVPFSADAEAMMAMLMTKFEEKAKVVLVSELDLKTEEPELLALLDILKDTTVYNALNYFEALKNAVDHETRQKTKEWKLSDLEIILL